MVSSFTGVAPERLAGLKADEEERQEVAGNSECRSSFKKSQRKRRRLSGKHSGKKQEDNRHPHLVNHITPHTDFSAVSSYHCDPFHNTELGLYKLGCLSGGGVLIA